MIISVPLSQKVIDAQTKVELKIPQLTLAKITQMGRHESVETRSEHYRQYLGSRVQSMLATTFLLNLFCSNTILAELTE